MATPTTEPTASWGVRGVTCRDCHRPITHIETHTVWEKGKPKHLADLAQPCGCPWIVPPQRCLDVCPQCGAGVLVQRVEEGRYIPCVPVRSPLTGLDHECVPVRRDGSGKPFVC